jgi:hypothetical protein
MYKKADGCQGESMRDVLYYSGLVIGAACTAGFVGGGSLILICYIVGELQRRGRQRMQRRRAAFETDMMQAARREMIQRELRLAKEHEVLMAAQYPSGLFGTAQRIGGNEL